MEKQRKEKAFGFEWRKTNREGHNSHLRSLHTFMDLSSSDLAIRVWSQPFSVNDVVTTIGRKPFRLINLPFYMVGNINKIIDSYS